MTRGTVAAALAAIVLTLGACGDGETDTPPDGPEPTTSTESSTESTTSTKTESAETTTKEEHEVSGVDIVATCTDLFDQDVTSTGPPVAGFVACLKRMDAPQDVIDSWTGG